MKVFVIEDNPVYNDYVCNLLKKDSFDTMSAYNLATAKKLLAKSEVDDIVVADLRLPDGESIELLRWMRANDKQQVFIVMTNYGEVHTAVESMKLGSKDYIQKQLLEDKLIPLIRTLQKNMKATTMEHSDIRPAGRSLSENQETCAPCSHHPDERADTGRERYGQGTYRTTYTPTKQTCR